MVSDSQIEMVHAKEIRRCTLLLATHISHWAILYRLCIQLVTTMSSLYYIFCFLYWANRQNNEGQGTNDRSPVILYNQWKKKDLTRHVTDGRCVRYKSDLNWIWIRYIFNIHLHSEHTLGPFEFSQSTYIKYPVYFAKITWLCTSPIDPQQLHMEKL